MERKISQAQTIGLSKVPSNEKFNRKSSNIQQFSNNDVDAVSRV